MCKIGTCLLLVLAAWSLWKGSLAEDLLPGNVDDEPYPSQCESCCLNALQPLLIEIKSKLNKQEDQQVKMEERLEANLEDQQHTVQTKVKEVQDNHLAVETMLRDQHQAAQNKIEGQLRAVQSKVEEAQDQLMEQHHTVQTKVDEVQAKLERDLLAVKTTLQGQQAVLTKIETQLQTVIKNINANQAAIEDIPERVNNKVPKGFERIGERYFRIVHDELNWHSAAEKCREMGGYLAAFRNKKEFDVVRAKLRYIRPFWTGINDLDTNGHFVSVASKKKAETFVYNGDGKKGCVHVYSDFLQNSKCDEKYYFVCQSDNET